MILEGPGYARVTCNSTFEGSVISNCELSGINVEFEVPCKLTSYCCNDCINNCFIIGNFDESTLLTVTDIPPGDYNFTVAINDSMTLTEFQFPVSLSGTITLLFNAHHAN